MAELTLPSAPHLYPAPSQATLASHFVGKQIKDVQAPAAIIDAAIVRRNCDALSNAINRLGVGFRAHVKTHKTLEMTKLQVGGSDAMTIKLVCSTVSEIEHLLPWLVECKAQGKHVDVLYGLPVAPSQVARLGKVALALGEGTLGVFVDHTAQIKALENVKGDVWPGHIPIWVAIDVGYHREGVTANSSQLGEIARVLETTKRVKLAGLYSHLGSSYGSASAEDALKYMAEELRGLKAGAEAFLRAGNNSHTGNGKITLSLGASPTATATQNLFGGVSAVHEYRSLIDEVKQNFALEFHAGVYCVNDLQQLAAHATHDRTYDDIGFRILAEVASVYADRADTPEILVAAGSIVLGREPCKSYPGWAVVAPWPDKTASYFRPGDSSPGWMVGRISQEHGILTWEGRAEQVQPLEVGEKVLLWPNHACIAGVNFGWYLVVDSDEADPEMIQDVWLRWRGW